MYLLSAPTAARLTQLGLRATPGAAPHQGRMSLGPSQTCWARRPFPKGPRVLCNRLGAVIQTCLPWFFRRSWGCPQTQNTNVAPSNVAVILEVGVRFCVQVSNLCALSLQSCGRLRRTHYVQLQWTEHIRRPVENTPVQEQKQQCCRYAKEGPPPPPLAPPAAATRTAGGTPADWGVGSHGGSAGPLYPDEPQWKRVRVVYKQ